MSVFSLLYTKSTAGDSWETWTRFQAEGSDGDIVCYLIQSAAEWCRDGFQVEGFTCVGRLVNWMGGTLGELLGDDEISAVIENSKRESKEDLVDFNLLLNDLVTSDPETFRRVFTVGSVGTFLPISHLPSSSYLLSKLATPGSPIYVDEAKRTLSNKACSASEKIHLMRVLAMFSTCAPEVEEVFKITVGDLIGLNTTPSNYGRIVQDLKALRMGLRYLKIYGSSRISDVVTECLKSRRFTDTVTSLATFPVTTGQEGLARVSRESRGTRRDFGDWDRLFKRDSSLAEQAASGNGQGPDYVEDDLTLGVLGSTNSEVVAMAKEVVREGMGLIVEMWSVNRQEMVNLSLSAPGCKGENSVNYESDIVVSLEGQVASNNKTSLDYIMRYTTTANANASIGVAHHAWSIATHTMSQNVPILDVVDIRVVTKGFMEALNSSVDPNVAVAAIDFVLTAVSTQLDVAGRILVTDRVWETVLGAIKGQDFDILVKARCAELIAKVVESPTSLHQTANPMSSAMNALNALPDLFQTLTDTIASPLPPPPSLSSLPSDIRTYTYHLNLTSSTLRTLSVTIHNARNSALPPHLHSFLTEASRSNSYDVWTSTFMHYNEELLTSTPPPIAKFDLLNETYSLNLLPSSFAKSTMSSFASAVEVYDTELAAASIEHVVPDETLKADVLGHLDLYNAVWSLGSGQACLIRCWRQFVEICVLKSTEATGMDHSAAKGSQGQGDASTDGCALPATPRSDPAASPARKRTSSFEEPASPQPTHPDAPSTFPGDFRSHKMVLHVAESLASAGVDSSALALSSPTIAKLTAISQKVGTYASAIVAVEMTEAFVSMLHHQLHIVHSLSANPGMTKTTSRRKSRLYDTETYSTLLLSAEMACRRLFKDTEPLALTSSDPDELRAKSDAYELGCKLRLRLFSATVLLVRACRKYSGTVVDGIKCRLVGLCCEVLTLLKCGRGGEGGKYWYKFDGGREVGADDARMVSGVGIGMEEKKIEDMDVEGGK